MDIYGNLPARGTDAIKQQRVTEDHLHQKCQI